MSDSSGVTLIWRPTVVTIATIALDASITEKHKTEVDTTDSPVEKGVDVTDHLRRKPDRLTIEGIVTNYPIGTNPESGLGLLNSLNVQVTESGEPTLLPLSGQNTFVYKATAAYVQGRAEEAYAALLDLAGSPTLIQIVTSLRTYDNMALTSLEVPRNAQIGAALRFTAEFKEIQIVENETIQEAVSQPSAKKNMDKGKVAATPNPNGASALAAGATASKGTFLGNLFPDSWKTPIP